MPEGLENIFVLSLVVALFSAGEALLRDSGLTAVVVAGMTVRNVGSEVSRHLLDFKEQLTVLMISVLFVLLAADVRVADVRDLGWPALGTVALLMIVVRPVGAWICTAGANLDWKERAYVASMAPRGIVAAAVASLFAETLIAQGQPGGPELRALVFLVIAVTVTVHGVTGGLLAQALDLRRPSERGWVILGANGLGFALAQRLREEQPDVVFIDTNPEHVRAARARGFAAIHGQGLQPSVLEQVDLDARLGCIALTPNEEVNLLWATRVRQDARVPTTLVALRREPGGIPLDSVRKAGASLAFGRGADVAQWSAWLDAGRASIESWRCVAASGAQLGGEAWDRGTLLMLATQRGDRVRPVTDETVLAEGDGVDVAILQSARKEVEGLLREAGLEPVEDAAQVA